MATMRVFGDEAAAIKAAEALMAAGVSGEHIQIVHAPANLNATQERVGTFDDEDARGEREGTFDNANAQTQREGSFDDTSGHRHNVREERQGSFADTDGLDRGPHHSRDLDAAGFNQALATAGVDRDQVMHGLAGSRSGVVLIVDSGVTGADDIARILG